MDERNRCIGKTKHGSPCRLPRLDDGEYCVNHDPDRRYCAFMSVMDDRCYEIVAEIGDYCPKHEPAPPNKKFKTGKDMLALRRKLKMEIKEFSYRLGKLTYQFVENIERNDKPLTPLIAQACETMASGEYLGHYTKPTSKGR